MKKNYFMLLLCCILAIQGIAQNGIVKGIVKGGTTVLNKATIALLQANDSVAIKYGVSNSEGIYEIDNVKPGNYIVQVSNVGYNTILTSVINVTSGGTTIVPNVNLIVAPKVSEAATVTGTKKKPLIEVRADKMIFNVESSINAIGSNAFELLRKSPGVVIDKDDNLMLKGKNGVRIFLDGKLTPFDGKDLAAFLKNINSADIESIELITNPSARYEAEGNAGIINIKLKKNKKLGYNGSINTGFAIGIHPKTNSALSMNYKKGDWNLFSNYSNNFGKNEMNFNFYRIQLDSIFDQKNKMFDLSKSHNFKAGADYYADKNNTFGVVLTGGFNGGGFESNSITPIYNKFTNVLGSTLTASNIQDLKRNNLNLNLNYRYTDSTGIEAGVDFDRGSFDNEGNSFQTNQYRYQNNLLNPVYRIYNNITPTNIDINSLKFDLGIPYKKGKLELGAKVATVKTKNASDFYNVVNSIKTIDAGLTNKFTYKENINALYANYNRPLSKKVTLQLGVRMENTNSEGVLTSNNPQPTDVVKRSYTNLFPSGALSYNASMNHMWNFTYSRRIDRPGYQDLNPFEYKIDELSYMKGNPFLKPQYSNVVELTHTYKYRYNTTLSYTRTTDFTSQWIDYDGYRSFVTNRNLAIQDVAGINFSAPVQFNKWWSLFANVGANYTKYNATLPSGAVLNTSVTSGNLFAQNTFSLKKGYSVELSGFYQLPSIWGGTFKSIGLGGIDLGLQAPLFNNAANIRFSFTDVLKTLKFRGTSDFNGAYFDASGRWESQQFKMNFNWRFGNKQLKAGGDKKSGNEDEQKRANKKTGGFGG